MATQRDDRQYGDAALYRRLLAQTRPVSQHVLGVAVLSLLAAPLALLVPIPLKIVLDSVVGKAPLPAVIDPFVPDAWAADPHALLVFAVVAIVGLSALVHVRNALYHVYSTWLGARLTLGLRAKLFGHLQRLSLGHHQEMSVPDALYRVQLDVKCMESIVQALAPLVGVLVQVVLVVVVTAMIDATLLWVAFGGAVVTLGCIELCRRNLRRRWAKAHGAESSALSVVGESLDAIRVVKAFGLEDRQRQTFRERGEHATSAVVAAARGQGVFDLVSGLISATGAAVILYVGGRHVLDGRISLGDLALLLTYLFQVYRPARQFGSQMAHLQGALASAARVFELLDRSPDVEDRPDAQPLQRAQGALAVEGLAFSYGRGAPVLRDVHFDIPAGSRVAVAGRTGAGKSTLLSLLPRMYDPQTGIIRLDGVDVRDIRLADLRRQFGIVLQDDMLFSGTVRENIAVGRADASDDEIQRAAQDAAAHDFIAALPNGYDTHLGERGQALSGGERQRISLARAFLRDAPILILDEPTSALDSETEALVMQAIERLMKGRTTLIIAHRMSSLVNADMRLVVSGGRVRERDTQLDEVVLG